MSIWCKKFKFAWMDGSLVECEKAQVHVLTHALHYGTGVFEGIRGYWNGENLYVFRLREHLERLLVSAKIVGLKLDYSVKQLIDAVLEVIRANEFKENIYIRPIVFVGEGSISLDISGLPVRTAITAFPFGHYLKPEGIRVKIVSWRRIPGFSLPISAKATGIYLNSVMSLAEAKREGYDEAILLDWRGYISEGSGENVFIVRRGLIATPPVTASILEGITRDAVIKIARDLGYVVEERDITRDELYSADEAFMTGTAAEITPIVEVDGKPVGEGSPGPVTRRLQKEYRNIVMAKNEKYMEWLTPVY